MNGQVTKSKAMGPGAAMASKALGKAEAAPQREAAPQPIECSTVSSPQVGASAENQGGTQAVAQTLTVGEKKQLVCKTAETAIKPGVPAVFYNADPQQKYVVQFLGEPAITADTITQTFTSYKVGQHSLGQIRVRVWPGAAATPAPSPEAGGPPGASASPGLNGQSSPAATPAPQDYQASLQRFEVKSVIQAEEGAQPTPFPSMGPERVPAPWWWWALWITLIVVLVGFSVRRYMQYKKRKALLATQQAEQELTPAQKFQKRLRKLESHNYHMQSQYKAFALELTTILKTALADNFGFAAQDMTTEEVLEILQKKYKPFYGRTGTRLEAVLNELDRIKFAKTETTPERCVAILDEVMQIGHVLFGGAS